MFKIEYEKLKDAKGTEHSVKVMVPVTSEEEFRNLRNSVKNIEVRETVKSMYEEIHRMTLEGVCGQTLEDYKEKLKNKKGKLVQMVYSCVPTAEGRLKGSKVCTPAVGMDVDFNIADPDYEQKVKDAEKRILDIKEQLGLLMLERSSGKGHHIVFRRHTDMTQEENLRWAANLIGCKFDEGAKDITRVFFTTTASEDDLLYLNPDLFLPEMNQPAELQADKTSEQALHVTATATEAAATVVATSTASTSSTATESVSQVLTPDPSAYKYQDLTYAEIIDKYWEIYNDGKTPTEGARESLTFELARNLAPICNYSPQELRQVVPVYDRLPLDDYNKALNSAVGQEHKGIPLRMRTVLQSLKSAKSQQMPLGMTSDAPPPLKSKMPESLRKIAALTPDLLKTTVSEGVFGALATHLHGVTFRILDGTEKEPALMQLLINKQSSGKGCIDTPIKCILESILARDKVDRARETEWKQYDPQGGKGKSKKGARPDDLLIRILQSDMTHASFVQRLIDADNNGQYPLFTLMQEFDEITALVTNGKSDPSRIIRKGFDRSDYGQERVSKEAITGVAPLRLNFTAATTPYRAKQMCQNWVSDGTLSRLNLLTIGDSEPMQRLRYKPVTQKYKDSIAPYIARLQNASGLITCRKADKWLEKMQTWIEDEIARTDSESFTTFASRALTIAYFKAMILYIMEGKWSTAIEQYAQWALQRDLWTKMHYFGKRLEDIISQEQAIPTYHPKNILETFGKNFTEQVFIQRRIEFGLKGDWREHMKKLKYRHQVDYDETIGMYVNLYLINRQVS